MELSLIHIYVTLRESLQVPDQTVLLRECYLLLSDKQFLSNMRIVSKNMCPTAINLLLSAAAIIWITTHKHFAKIPPTMSQSFREWHVFPLNIECDWRGFFLRALSSLSFLPLQFYRGRVYITEPILCADFEIHHNFDEELNPWWIISSVLRHRNDKSNTFLCSKQGRESVRYLSAHLT